jgi:hypothetical protein
VSVGRERAELSMEVGWSGVKRCCGELRRFVTASSAAVGVRDGGGGDRFGASRLSSLISLFSWQTRA